MWKAIQGQPILLRKKFKDPSTKAIQGLGRTAAVQCACNSLFALCWSQVKTVSRWNKSDLNHVLTEGDLLYKSLNVVDMLTADDLPRSIVMCNIEFPVDFLELKTEIAHLRNGESFLRRSVPNTGDEFMFLLFMGGFTTALMKHHNHFYLFDSHSRDSRGLSVVDGTSVLMKFSDLFEVENYIQVYTSFLSRVSQHGAVLFSVAVYSFQYL